MSGELFIHQAYRHCEKMLELEFRRTNMGFYLQINFRWIYLPYCMKKLESGDWLPLNRHYKPLGISNEQTIWVDHEEYGFMAIPMATDLNATGEYWFYNDGTVPNNQEHMKQYMQLLRRTFPFLQSRRAA